MQKIDNDRIALLKCTSAYPAPLEEINLRTIPDLKEKFETMIKSIREVEKALGAVTYDIAESDVIDKKAACDIKAGAPLDWKFVK